MRIQDLDMAAAVVAATGHQPTIKHMGTGEGVDCQIDLTPIC